MSVNKKLKDVIDAELKLHQVEVTGSNYGVKSATNYHNYMSVSISESKKMTEMYLDKNEEPSYTPFYYDQQLRNKRMTVTLHPNAKYAGETWVPFQKDECFSMNVLKSGNNVNSMFLYRIKPIATAIMGEDFSVNVSNAWTDFGKDSQIEGMFNGMKPYAPMIGKLSRAFHKISEEGKKENNGKETGTVAGFLGKAAEFMGTYGSQASNVLNRHLTVQGTRFSYFSGTTTSFGNLNMKFTVFSDWIWNGSEYEFTTCYEQLDELYDYAMSKYKKVDGTVAKSVSEWIATNVFSADSSTTSKIGQETREFWEEHLKWQLPPGGFIADLKSIDNVQRGTLKLRINDMYSLENLVITSMQVLFSRIPCKCPTDKDKGKIVPLYADVTLSLQPSTLYSDSALRAFTEGKAFATIEAEKILKQEDAVEESKKYLNKDNIWEKLVAIENGLYDDETDKIVEPEENKEKKK